MLIHIDSDRVIMVDVLTNEARNNNNNYCAFLQRFR